MTDSTIIKYSGDWILYQGETVSGALLYVYNSGTTDLVTLYPLSDLTGSLSNPVVADSGGLMPYAYKGTGAYKVVIKTSAGTTIDTEDAIPGALDTSTFTAATFAKPDTDCSAKTSDYTVVSGDLGTVINCNVTSAAITITLISAVTATNGRGVTIRHTGTANQVKITSVSSQTITQPATGVTTTAFALVGYGESVTLTSDGAGWHVTGYVPPFMRPNTPGIIQITDRVSAAPSSPVAGARYIVSAAYSTFEQEDIIEFDGTTYIEYTPTADCGWLAYVQDEDVFYAFIGSAWVELLRPATQAEQVTAASLINPVTPGRQQFHYSAAKMWGVVTVSGGVPTLQLGYNLTSITDTASGRLTVTIATDFSSANWCTLATTENPTTGGRMAQISDTTRTAGTIELSSIADSGALQDPVSWSFAGFGAQ